MKKRWKKDLKEVVCINSYTANKKGVDNTGNLFRKWLEEIGLKTEVYQRELIGDHLHFISKKSGTREKILLLGHLDTVFPPGTFEGFTEDETWVYGPGVCDMKGGNIVAIESLRAVYKKFGSIEDIDFLLVSDEETGSDDSKQLTKEIAKSYDICFVFEAAGKDMNVVIGRKGIGTFEITIDGKAAHAGTSYSKGCDANLEAAIKLQKLVSLTDLQKGSTVNVGKIEGGIGANTISPHSKLLLELRYADYSEKKRLINALDEIVKTSFVKGTNARLSGSIQRDVMEPNSSQIKLIDVMEHISGQTLPTEKRGGVSDANIVASCGVVTIDGLGPFGDGDHTPKERALKSSFDERIELMTKVLIYHQRKGRICE
ncbi:M20 family metallopeptidase [Hydrogenimonas thermophila]|uniref:M20 family metallopeptidase n=1 Tax=Hydrogenimonas thermophila TaxID=223786 RepID=UPI002937239A|nr:M20 family metallopeptidase [Hydrogenimonas thermophila]WOE69971.1 M20 family metallopeptidase [Hydrogenimonas thermophila]WOE72488.1 M20 family metallopeptidase [Hydrogenimonas thermophila]